VATAQRRRAETAELEAQLTIFKTRLADLDDDSKAYFKIMRRRLLEKLVAGTGTNPANSTAFTSSEGDDVPNNYHEDPDPYSDDEQSYIERTVV